MSNVPCLMSHVTCQLSHLCNQSESKILIHKSSLQPSIICLPLDLLKCIFLGNFFCLFVKISQRCNTSVWVFR